MRESSVYQCPKIQEGVQNKKIIMEGNYLTSGDLALFENRRGWGYGDYYEHRGCNRGAATTGVALGASALGVALIGTLAIGWGVNQASKARARAAENVAAGNSKAIDIIASQVLCERNSREAWQMQNMPNIVQYTNANSSSGAGSLSASSALATAEALALLNQQNNGINSAIGGCNFLRVARYSAPAPCPCDSCQG